MVSWTALSSKLGASHTVRNDDRVFPLDRLVSNGFGQVDSKEDRVHLSANRIEGSLKEDYGIVGKLHVV
jgi:hypothetical protein